TPDALVEALRPVVKRIPADALEDAERDTVYRTLARMTQMPFRLDADEHAAFQRAMGRLAEWLESSGDHALLARAVRNKAAFADMIQLMMRQGSPESRLEAALIRETRMAENLLWLARERYPDRKIIVWAATSHMSYGEAGLEMADSDGGWSAMATQWAPMGEAVKAELGDDLYTVAFIAHSGTIGSVAGWTRPLEPPPPGSLDDLCERTGRPYLFVDLRTMPERPGGAWLREKLVARPRGYAVMRASWPTVCDGMLFTERMLPSTPREGRTYSRRTFSSQERAIRGLLAQHGEAVDRGDVDALAALFTDDADVVTEQGIRARGAEQVRVLQEGRAGAGPGGEPSRTVVEAVDFASPTVAVVHVRERARSGGAATDHALDGTRIVQRGSDGTWRVRAMIDTPRTSPPPGVADLAASLEPVGLAPGVRLVPDGGPPPGPDEERAIRETLAPVGTAAGEDDAVALRFTADAEIKPDSAAYLARGLDQVRTVERWKDARNRRVETAVESVDFMTPRIALARLTVSDGGGGDPATSAGLALLVRGDDDRWRIRLLDTTRIDPEPSAVVRALQERLDAIGP
ncbi:MAG: SgcJ/EcaC family oxidoreductase, partial [Planctomycetota bacterium]